MLSSTESSRIQGLFQVFELFSNTFQGRFSFKKALQIQVLFKHVRTLTSCQNNVQNLRMYQDPKPTKQHFFVAVVLKLLYGKRRLRRWTCYQMDHRKWRTKHSENVYTSRRSRSQNFSPGINALDGCPKITTHLEQMSLFFVYTTLSRLQMFRIILLHRHHRQTSINTNTRNLQGFSVCLVEHFAYHFML